MVPAPLYHSCCVSMQKRDRANISLLAVVKKGCRKLVLWMQRMFDARSPVNVIEQMFILKKWR